MFVSYAGDSEKWVKNFLVYKAEIKWGLKLCINERDILGGTSLVDQIAECIGSSRHVVFILTPGLISKAFSSYEIDRAKYERANNHTQITVVNLDVPANEMMSEFSSVWPDVCVVEFIDSQSFSDIAWSKLKLRLVLNR